MVKESPMDILNKVKEKAHLNENKFVTTKGLIRLVPGKIKFQFLAMDSENLFRPRTQHIIPVTPNNDSGEKVLIADCIKENCPICAAVNAFKNSDIATVDDLNDELDPRYEYKNFKSAFTYPEHYILCAKVLQEDAENGSYIPKDMKIGDTFLVQFSKMALNNLVSAYQDYLEDLDEDAENAPSLFAIFDGNSTASSLEVTCRINYQPYSCQFSFGSSKVNEINIDDVNKDMLDYLDNSNKFEVSEQHLENCVNRIKSIQNYFVRKRSINSSTLFDNSNIPFNLNFSDDDAPPPKAVDTSTTSDSDDTNSEDDFNIDDLL